MSDVDVIDVHRTDLGDLTGALDHGPLFHDRFDRQQNGKGKLLMACRDGAVVGVVYLWLEPAEEPKIRKKLPGVPLLMHLEIRDDDRGRGYGTSLIYKAEDWLRERGETRLALAVDVANVEARNLYLRLGYELWRYSTVRCREFVDPRRRTAARYEKCYVMVKDLVDPDQPRRVRNAQGDQNLLQV